MTNTRLFKHTFTLFLIIGTLDFIAQKFYFYWTIWWYDMLLHFISGACVAMIALVLLNAFFRPVTLSKNKAMILSLIAVFIVGSIWEVYEWYFNISTLTEGANYYTDTSSDLILDMSGGLLGFLYGYKLLKKDQNGQ